MAKHPWITNYPKGISSEVNNDRPENLFRGSLITHSKILVAERHLRIWGNL